MNREQSGHQHHDEYGDDLIGMLKLVWGEGFLSPGGPAAARAIAGDADLRGRRVPDIGCGIGGFDVLLAQRPAIRSTAESVR